VTRADEFPFGPDLSLWEMLDCSNECRHGNLPLDPPPNCECWPGLQRVAPVKRLPVKRMPVKRPARPWKHPWTTRQQAIRLRESGLSFERVGVLVGVAPNSVRRWVRADGRRAA